MSGLTLDAVASLVALSGGPATRYSWQGVGGTSRPAAATRRGMRLFFYAAQDGLCADCGQALALDGPVGERAEFCHVVSRGLDADTSDQGKGWTEGNLFLGHRVCPTTGGESRGNKAQQARGAVVLPSHLLRPDLVPMTWPTVPTLKSMQA